MIKKIGEEITVIEDFKIELALSNDKIQVERGDKGYINSKGFIHYTTGKAKGRIQNTNDITIEGYDRENIAKLIFTRLSYNFNLDELSEGFDIIEKEFLNEIEDVLSEIL